MRARLAWLTALTALVGAGCRDLELPSDLSLTDPGPTLTFLSPVPLPDGGAAEVGLQGFVALSAEDADGVASVDLSCQVPDGGAPLAHLTLSPYQTSVNFGPCRPPGTPTSAALSIILSAIGTDVLGNLSAQTQQVQVHVNAATASLSLDAPARVAPGKPFDLTVNSDLPLQGAPLVAVDGLSAQLIDSAVDGGLSAYHFRTAAAPLLGADRWDGGLPVPLDVLEETDVPITVKVDAVATTGNASELTGQVVVSRVLWDTPLPSNLLASAIDTYNVPTVAPGGLHLQLNAAPTWIPAFLDATSGQLTLPQPGVFSTALAPRGFDAKGRVVLSPTVAGTAPYASLIIEPVTLNTLRTANPSVLQTVNHPLLPLGNQVCEENFTQPTCPGVAPSLRCLSASGERVIANLGATPYSNGAPPYSISSGSTLLLGGMSLLCTAGQAMVLVDTSQPVPAATLMPAGGQFTFANTRVFPVGDGTFVGVYPITTNEAFRFSAANPSIVGPVNTPSFGGALSTFAASEWLTVRPDASIIVYRMDPPYTYFMSFKAGDTTTTPPVRIDSAFQLGLGSLPHIPRNALLDAQGGLYVLMRRQQAATTERVVVLHLDASLQPRWIYIYPRPDTGATGLDFYLALDDALGVVYLVDGTNGHALALSR